MTSFSARGAWPRIAAIATALVLGASALWAGAAAAQAYPNRPVHLILGFPPGGAVDALARVVAPKLGDAMGQPIVIENKPGAAGNLATDFVAKSAPDGYTILLTTIGHTIAPSLARKPPFDAIADFVPVSQLIASSMVLVVPAKVTAKTLPEFIALAKAKPGGLNYGSSGVGDPLGLAMEVLKLQAGVDIVAIQYKGVGPTYTALLAGEVDAAFMPLSASLPYLKAGQLRALAIGSAQRSLVLPDLPTVAESGFPGFEAVNWQGFFVPAKTPPEIVARISADTAKVLAMPEVRDRLIPAGQDPIGSTPKEFEAKVAADAAKFARVIKEAKIPLQE
jgi:tripartite-type tricarboxylate transporter receptor subunit TctC